MEFVRGGEDDVSAARKLPNAKVSPRAGDPHDDDASLLQTVDSTSSRSSTVYDEDDQQPPPRPGSAPPNLAFEASNFFRFGGSSDFFSHMKYTTEEEDPTGSSGNNNDVLPPHVLSPTNQASHHEENASIPPVIPHPPRYGNQETKPTAAATLARPNSSGSVSNRRKNSIEMFLSQSPSQALGGDFLKLSLDDRQMSLQEQERGGTTHAYASGQFALNPVQESPNNFSRLGASSYRSQPQQQQQQSRYAGVMARSEGVMPPPIPSRSISTGSSHYSYQLSPRRTPSEDSWGGSQDGSSQHDSSYYQEPQHQIQDYYGATNQSSYANVGRTNPYHSRQQQDVAAMYRNTPGMPSNSSYGYGTPSRAHLSSQWSNPSSGPHHGMYDTNGYMNQHSHLSPMQPHQPPMHYQQHQQASLGMRSNTPGRSSSRQHPTTYSRIALTPPLPEASPPHSPRKGLPMNGISLGNMSMTKQCKFFLHGHCRMGAKCKFSHQTGQNQQQEHSLHHASQQQHLMMSGNRQMMYQGRMAMSPPTHHLVQQHHGMVSDDGTHQINGQYSRHHQSRMGSYRTGDLASVNGVVGSLNLIGSSQSGGVSPSMLSSQGDSANLSTALSVDDIQGRVFAMSKDQNGCRLLQEQLDYEDRKDLRDVIYQESLDHLSEMMVDPFGNYLFQKLLERVNEKQRLVIIRRVSSNLVAASLNLHGTRSVQKVVEVCATSPEVIEDESCDHDDGQIARGQRTTNLPDIIVEALKDDAVRLCIDSNGNHVIQRALQFMKPEYNQFVFDAVCKECTTVGTHRHGCCVLQRCLDAANKQQKTEVIMQVEKHAMKLMQDPYGNYVVQYVLDSCTAEEAYGVIVKPLGHIFELSIQKFSSNVIEKCLEKAPERVRQSYIKEITNCPKMNKMLQDQFANYVVQRALCVCSEEQCVLLVKAIRPHLACMKNTSGGRRITARILKRFPNMDISLDMGLSPTGEGMMYDNNKVSHLSGLSLLPPPASGYNGQPQSHLQQSHFNHPHSHSSYMQPHPPHLQGSGSHPSPLVMNDMVSGGLGMHVSRS